MVKIIKKYFSLPLILVLIYSNFSFVLLQEICMMSIMQDTCECEMSACCEKVEVNSDESDCCKVKLKEINNTNTLESNKLSLVKEIPFHFNHYFLKSTLNPVLSYSFNFNISHFKPPDDISILISHIII